MKLRRSSSDDKQEAASDVRYDTATPPVANDATAALAMQAADVQNARFHTARKGYHKGEVDDFLDRVEAAIEAKNARIAELEAQTAAATAPAAAPAAVAAVPAAAPAVAATPAESYPAQQAAQPAAPQAAPAFGVPDALSAAVPEQVPAAAPATPAASAAPTAAQAAGDDGDGSFAAGWYADPWSQATYRYYDGSDWTAQTR